MFIKALERLAFIFAEVPVNSSTLSNWSRVNAIRMKTSFSLLLESLGYYVNNLINTYNMNHPGLVIWPDSKRTIVAYIVVTAVAKRIGKIMMFNLQQPVIQNCSNIL